jgi:hypothetical protein
MNTAETGNVSATVTTDDSKTGGPSVANFERAGAGSKT